MATLDADARVTVAMISDIISTDLSESSINACINTAHHIVDAQLVSDGILDAEMLTDIEMYLAAHFVAVRDPRATSERIGSEYQVAYERGQQGEGLKATTYGQQALGLDYTGKLAVLGQKQATIRLV
jgi:hypothetical protein